MALPQEIIRWLPNSLNNRMCKVDMNGAHSGSFSPEAGVSQLLSGIWAGWNLNTCIRKVSMWFTLILTGTMKYPLSERCHISNISKCYAWMCMQRWETNQYQLFTPRGHHSLSTITWDGITSMTAVNTDKVVLTQSIILQNKKLCKICF
ncbi:uncharacterized protein LOC143226847 [Tachypleus tridentatus]|uniref:uncharacterized protein LOC143226847 n=1 Tax=Tachypleus tridentatus TaxID=6853 RepID=UPI003FD342D7